MLQFYEVHWEYKVTGCPVTPHIKSETRIVLVDKDCPNFSNQMAGYRLNDITWNNAERVLRGFRCRCYPFYYENGRIKGYDMFNGEWVLSPNYRDMKIICTTNIYPTQLSIKEIMDWPESDKAIRYLNERGLSVVM